MSRPTTIIEWYTAQDDAEWAAHTSTTDQEILPKRATAGHGYLDRQGFLGAVAVLLLLLMSAGDWWWRTDRDRFQQAASDATATTQQELGDGAPDRDALVARNIDSPSTPG